MKTTTISKLFIAAIAVVMCSCEPENEDIVKSPSKDGSIETEIKINHQEKFDVLTTTHTVWVKNRAVKTITKVDTLPSLGLTTQVGENSEGEEKTLSVPKNYELYITVK